MKKTLKKSISISLNLTVILLSIIYLFYAIKEINTKFFYSDLNFICNCLNVFILLIFIIYQFINIKDNKFNLFIYKMYYILISFNLINLVSNCYFIFKFNFFFEIINLLSFISPFLLFVNFLFFIGDGKYVFLNSTLSIILISIYEITISILISYKYVENKYLFIDFNNKLIVSIIYLVLIVVLQYFLSSIILMYHRNGQQLTDSFYIKDKKYYLVHSLFK